MPPNERHAVKATKQFSMLLTLSKPEAPATALNLNLKTEAA
jgi:quercetin dioxygenase-like cupin family protein